MTNTETINIVKVLLNHIGDRADQDKAIANGCIVLLDNINAEPPKADKPTEPKPKRKRTKKTDHGKICACYKAGWPVKEIAKEVDASEGTVRYHLQKEGLMK